MKLAIGISGAVHFVLGILTYGVWASFATLYVMECPEFSLTAAGAQCRWIAAWCYGGLGLSAVSAVMVLGAVAAVIAQRARRTA